MHDLMMCVSCVLRKEYSGAADEWTEHRQFLPSIEFCAAKVSHKIFYIFSVSGKPYASARSAYIGHA